jgi:CelD/BcsL family acetyltransferase involved in cellulose biosynthesis
MNVESVGEPSAGRTYCLAAEPIGLDIEEREGVSSLYPLREAWSDLWDRCPWATPFQSPEWLFAWCEAFEPEDAVTLVLRRGGEIVGIAPFVRMRIEGERVLMPLGCGVSDYLDVVVAPAHKRAGAERMLGWLASSRGRWDRCELSRLRSSSPLLGAAAPSSLVDRRWDDEPSPILRLPAFVADLAEVLPRGLAASVRYERRRAERVGRARIDRANTEDLDASLDALFDLHGARCRDRGLPDGLADARVQAFHRRAAHGLLAIGALRLYVLRWEERPAAALYGFSHRGRAYSYISGFDPGLRRFSVGTLIVAHAIEQAIREGAGEMDFLRGREPYKYRWGAVDRSSYGRTLRPAPEGGSRRQVRWK